MREKQDLFSRRGEVTFVVHDRVYVPMTKKGSCGCSKKIRETVCAVQLVRSVTRDTWCIVLYVETRCTRIIFNEYSSFFREMKNNASIFVKVF